MRTVRRSISVYAASLILLSPVVEAQVQAGRSETDLLTAVAAQPSDLRPYLELATLYRNTNRRDEAETLLRQALTFHPKEGAVYSALATLYEPLKEAEAILGIADEWRRAAPTDTRPLLLALMVHMAKAEQARETPAEAIAHMDRALEAIAEAERISPGDPRLRASRLALIKHRIPLTDDPQERERLSQELAAGEREFSTQRLSAAGSASSADVASQPLPPYPSNAVRVGGNVKPPTKIKDVEATFPPVAQQARVQGASSSKR
jgi:tetratricopeptide (TPR) repeat protein